MATRAGYCCPSVVPTRPASSPHFRAYFYSDPSDELAEVMWRYIAAGTQPQREAARQFRDLANQVAAPACKRRLRHRLEQLAGGPHG